MMSAGSNDHHGRAERHDGKARAGLALCSVEPDADDWDAVLSFAPQPPEPGGDARFSQLLP